MSERKQRGLEGQIRLAGAGAPQENITAWMCLQLYAGRLWTEVKYLSHWGVSGLTLQVLKARSDWFPGQMCLPTLALKKWPVCWSLIKLWKEWRLIYTHTKSNLHSFLKYVIKMCHPKMITRLGAAFIRFVSSWFPQTKQAWIQSI